LSTVNSPRREAVEEEGRAPVLLTLLTLHECRHTFASLLIDTGANPKAIQVVMGHSKIQTTFDVHGHLLPGSYDDVRARMDAYLAGSDASGSPGTSAGLAGTGSPALRSHR
jgi:integrase